MTELTLWRRQEIDKLRKDIDLLFRQFRRDFGVPRSLLEAAESYTVNLAETENTLTVIAELAGVKPEDIKISVTDDSLTLKAEVKEDTVAEGDHYRRVEKRSKSFSRTLSLPCRIMTQDVKAAYKDGVLKIVLPKCKPLEERGITIEIE